MSELGEAAFVFTQIHIQNFRSFRDIEISPFNRINLISGLNNTGKTGLLEAIFLTLQRGQSQNQETKPGDLPNLFRVFSQNADLKKPLALAF
jgi:AAA15 family ATPase/GTPase